MNVKSKKAVNQTELMFNAYTKKKKSLMSYLIWGTEATGIRANGKTLLINLNTIFQVKNTFSIKQHIKTNYVKSNWSNS